jgi:hypothetical protein
MNLIMEEELLSKEWDKLNEIFTAQFGKTPDINAILFLIGVQELGKGKKNFTKEEKQDLMHIAVCKLLSLSGYYELEGTDSDGWPHWKLVKKLPFLDLTSQEKLLKAYILAYFSTETAIL